MVSIDTMEAVVLNQESKRIESEADIQAYLDKLCYALNNNAIIPFNKRGVLIQKILGLPIYTQ